MSDFATRKINVFISYEQYPSCDVLPKKKNILVLEILTNPGESQILLRSVMINKTNFKSCWYTFLLVKMIFGL